MRRVILFAAAAILTMPMLANAQNVAKTAPVAKVAAPKAAAFTLPALPYAYDALDVAIDAETMTIHHDKHHKAYVDSLNKAVEADAKLQGLSLDQIVAKAGTYPAVVRNNAGGHWNHSFYWRTMNAPDKVGKISPELEAAIVKSFGSVDGFKAEFKKAGLGRFGSGWAWLIVDKDGKLVVTSTPNQDNPLMDVAEVKGKPILGNDVWEHAYYLKYQNRRADYLDSWWKVVDWGKVSARYAKAIAK